MDLSRLPIVALADSYKHSHHKQYPKGTTFIYSNFTPRWPYNKHTVPFVFFGAQYFVEELNRIFENNFFGKPKADVLYDCNKFIKDYYGVEDKEFVEKLGELHDLSYLPLEIKAVEEGTHLPHGVAAMTLYNTNPNFFWLTNFVETWLSNTIWPASTSASTANVFRNVLDKWAIATGVPLEFVPFQGHDFSMRGMHGLVAAAVSGAGHLVSFYGSDTCIATEFIRDNYNGTDNGEIIATSVPATEHSVMESYGNDYDAFGALLDIHPSGFISIVSDTWDYWNVVDTVVPAHKDKILARDGKLVLRPDSSPKTPLEIICGDPTATPGTAEYKGTIRCLDETFGHTVNAAGYKVLDPHIGCIYGEGIAIDLADKILQNLALQGYASSNIVFGIGSFAYTYVTRDTHGIAVKATCRGEGWKDGRPEVVLPIFKDPKTGKNKKSAKGLLYVLEDAQHGIFMVESDHYDEELEKSNKLKTIYKDGKILTNVSFSDVREVSRRYRKNESI